MHCFNILQSINCTKQYYSYIQFIYTSMLKPPFRLNTILSIVPFNPIIGIKL